MTPQQLRNSILQMAIEGKLTRQLPEDGNAADLLKKIKAEKARLIKEKKIKKEKPLPEIRDDEVPFEIPDNWCWVRLGEIVNLLSGQDLTADKYNNLLHGIPYITGASNFEHGNIIVNRWTSVPKAIARKGDLLLTCKGTVGKMAVLNVEKAHIARQIMSISVYRQVYILYVKTFLSSYVGVLQKKAKSMIPGISRGDICHAIVPIPPLDEQKRIVDKLEQLLSLCEELKC